VRDLLNACLVASLLPTGMAVDHWAVQLRALVRAVWHLFVLWVQAVTSGLPLVGPLVAAAPGVHHGSPEEIEARRARRDAAAEQLRVETAAAALAVDESAEQGDEVEDPAEQLEKTQPFKPYLVKGVA
jgi:hypothetical protein